MTTTGPETDTDTDTGIDTGTDTGIDIGTDTGTTPMVTFIQLDVPPLRTGVYTLTATGTVPGQTPGTFPATARFVVQGERFSLATDDIAGVFPPALATGEFDGVLPHVVLSRQTLPWERSLSNGHPTYATYPWLAVLLFDDAAAPKHTKVTAADLVPAGTPITLTEGELPKPAPVGTLPAPVTVGTLPATTLSYGADTLLPLGYGEAPGDDCLVIDIPVDIFNQVAPSPDDLSYLTHIRKVDVTGGVDGQTTETQVAVVVGNRIPSLNAPVRAFLVSLENMASFLPADDGTPSTAIPAGTTLVRLLAYTTWTFTADTLDQDLESLLTHLNTVPAKSPSTLRLPISGTAPTAAQVEQAAANQAAAALGKGELSAQDAEVIVQNALAMGYVPLDHHLRHGGSTVTWYRGPLVPYPVATTIHVPISGPDAASRYDPQAGMFDVSYAAAWQLGQLLAIQNSAVANAIYAWKHQVRQQDAAAAEQAVIRGLLTDPPVLESLLAARDAVLDAGPPPLPADVVAWLGTLGRLEGVPFNALVPDERMLPPESMRFCFLDLNWVDALVDGAFSIGRSSQPAQTESVHAQMVRRTSRAALARPTRRVTTLGATNPTGQVTGFLMRSQAGSGWPNLRFKGFSDAAGHNSVKTLRQVTLAADTVLCLFDGLVVLVEVEEPPEQLHLGVEGKDGSYWTTLRSVDPPNPGEQLASVRSVPCNPTSAEAVVCLTMRADGRTLRVSDAATAIKAALVDDYHQTLADGFTSAELALELNKGVLVVGFLATTPQQTPQQTQQQTPPQAPPQTQEGTP